MSDIHQYNDEEVHYDQLQICKMFCCLSFSGHKEELTITQDRKSVFTPKRNTNVTLSDDWYEMFYLDMIFGHIAQP